MSARELFHVSDRTWREPDGLTDTLTLGKATSILAAIHISLAIKSGIKSCVIGVLPALIVAVLFGGLILFGLLWLWFWFEQGGSSRYSSQGQSGYTSKDHSDLRASPDTRLRASPGIRPNIKMDMTTGTAETEMVTTGIAHTATITTLAKVNR